MCVQVYNLVGVDGAFQAADHFLTLDPKLWAPNAQGVKPPPMQATYEVESNAVFWAPDDTDPDSTPSLDAVEGWKPMAFLVVEAAGEAELSACDALGIANEGLWRMAPATTSGRIGDMVSLGAGHIRNTTEYNR